MISASDCLIQRVFSLLVGYSAQLCLQRCSSIVTEQHFYKRQQSKNS